jgi:protease YdgD
VIFAGPERKNARGVLLAAILSVPGIGGSDHRRVVDPLSPPWNAIVRVQTNIGTRCTGALVAADRVLTAAHCLYNPLTRAMLQPVSLHVLFGYRHGTYRWHVLVRDYRIGDEFDRAEPKRRPGGDWALLDLAAAIPREVAPLPITAVPPVPGMAVALAGYNRDRTELLMADLACRVTGYARLRGADFLTDNCDATFGTSGGPVLAEQAGRWQIVGLNVAISGDTHLALPAAVFRCVVERC